MNSGLPRCLDAPSKAVPSASALLRRAAALSLLLGAIFLMLPASAHAKNLHARVGLGYNSQFANSSATNGVSAVSLKYGLTRDIAAAAVIGLGTQNPKNGVTAVKLFKNLFFENNLNFYFVVGGGIVSAAGVTGAEFLGGFGSEFFIPGLESLGFSFEVGASMDNLGGGFALKTFGASFLNAGIHFYF